jgi:hypothetical protein
MTRIIFLNQAQLHQEQETLVRRERNLALLYITIAACLFSGTAFMVMHIETITNAKGY